MDITTTILLIVGIIVIFIGIAAFINPNFTRLINAPGGPRLKAIIALISGIIIIVISMVIQIPG